MENNTQPENSGPQRTRNDKNGRRGWSTKEEEILADGMKKIIREGWKSENGFKTDFLKELQKYLISVNPNCNLQADPHINSRITVWKKNYNSLFEILKTTGVGMDAATHQVEATDDQWVGFIQKDSNARHMRHKSWPLYTAWCEIFGTTRATGEGAQDHNNAENAPTHDGIDSECHPIDVDEENEGESHNFNPQTVESSATGKQTVKGVVNRKRKCVDKPDPLIKIMNNFVDTASARLGEIAQRIGHEQDMSAARKKTLNVLTEMNCFTKKEKFRAAQLITSSTEKLDVFFALPEEDRVDWTIMVLDGEI